MMIHLITEAVALIALVMYINKQTQKLNDDIKQIKEELQQQKDHSNRCMHMIHQLYGIVEKFMAEKPAVVAPPQPQKPSFMSELQAAASIHQPTQSATASPMMSPQPASTLAHAAHAAAMMQQQQMQLHQQLLAQQQMLAQQQQQAQKSGGGNMMDTIFNILPSVMGPLMSGNKSGMIIAELEKPLQPAVPQQQEPTVEVCNEDDDPDVAEALEKMSAN